MNLLNVDFIAIHSKFVIPPSLPTDFLCCCYVLATICSCGVDGSVMQWRRIAEPDAIDSGDEAQRSGEDSELEADGGLRCCNSRKQPQQQTVRRSTQRTPRSFTGPFLCRVSFLCCNSSIISAWRCALAVSKLPSSCFHFPTGCRFSPSLLTVVDEL